MKADPPPSSTSQTAHPLAPIRSHLSVDAAPYVRNPSPADVVQGIPEADMEGEKDMAPSSTGDVESGEVDKDGFVEPGWKGWLNVVGSVAINMICCESSSLLAWPGPAAAFIVPRSRGSLTGDVYAASCSSADIQTA